MKHPSSTPMSDELRNAVEHIPACKDPNGDPVYLEDVLGTVDALDFYDELYDVIARHTKEAVARAKAEARKAAFDKIFEMAPKGNFEHWTKQMTANWFVALGRLGRELSAPQQSTGGGDA